MVVIVILVFFIVAMLELFLWSERNWQEVIAYLVLMGAAATLSVLVLLNTNLPVPEPLETIFNLFKKLWLEGGLS